MFSAGLPRLQFNADYKAYFDPEDPYLKRLEHIEGQFGAIDNALVILRRETGSMLTPEVYAIIDAISVLAWKLPYIQRVESILTIQLPTDDVAYWDEADAFIDGPRTDRQKVRLRTHPRVQGALLSHDARVTAIALTFRHPGVDTASELPNTAAAIRQLVDKALLSAPGDMEAHYTGTVMLGDNYVNVVRHDLKAFVPSLLIIFLVSLWVFFGSFSLAVLTLLMAALAVVTAFGYAGWLGLELTSVNTFVPIMIVSLSTAITVHMITAYLQQLHDGDSKLEAAQYSLCFNALAIDMTTLTTLVGFLGLTLSPSPPIRTTGLLLAFGSAAAYLWHVLGVPVLLASLKMGLPVRQITFFGLFNTLAKRGLFGRRTIVCCVVLTLMACIALARNSVDDNVIEYFPAHNAFRSATELANTQLAGVTTIDYVFDTGKANGLFDAEYLNTLIAFRVWLEQRDPAAKVLSVVDWTASFDGNIPDRLTQDQVDRYARLLRHSSPLEAGLMQEVTEDFSATRIRVALRHSDNRRLLDVDQRVRGWFKAHASGYALQGGAGPGLVFAHIGQRNLYGMLASLGIAVVLTAALIGSVTGSMRTVGICLFCNLVPLLWIFGLWSTIDGRLSLGATVVIGMILGIIVDDSIHFITKYYAFKQSSPSEVFRRVAPALTITTITLVLGLSVGLLSDFRPINTMSGLSVAVISLALAVDLLLLPSLLVMFLPTDLREPSINAPNEK